MVSSITNDHSEPATGRLTTTALAGIYIHVPFCLSKCPYCDFYSVTDPGRVSAYIEALLVELDMRRQSVPGADSIYFGGGTPSMLTPDQIARILDTVHARFAVTADAEITLEVNPGTVTKNNLTAYRQIGINRLNIGLQSIHDQTLDFLGRMHTADQGRRAIGWSRETAFDNVGVDLIYGVPGQTSQRWRAEMASVVQLAPEHLSCYALTLEPGTPMHAQFHGGEVRPLTEKRVGDLFSATVAFLHDQGYRQYEISNFAWDTTGAGVDRRSRHNRKYWTFAPYLGFGPSAHSFLDTARWWNHRCLDSYLADLINGKRPVSGNERLTRDQQIMEFVYLGLRQTDGIDPARFASRFNTDFHERFEPELALLIKEGLVERSSEWVRLTRRGMRYLEHVVDRLLS